MIRGPGLNAQTTASLIIEELVVSARIRNRAYAEGRKSKEKELEEKKAREDAILYGTGFMEGRKRVKPEHVYLSDAEIKLKKAAQDFQELLELADRMCDKMDEEFYYVAREFYDWKKARGIE